MGTYKIKGKRFLRSYKAEALTPSYSAAVDASRIVDELCDVPWEESGVSTGAMPAHAGVAATDTSNVESRKAFDAYEFCAEHANGVHRAYAGAACYRFVLPDGAVGVSLTSISCNVAADPYCVAGLRISVNTNSTGEIPMDCATCRNGASSDVSSAAQTNNGTESTAATEWYSTNTHVEGAAPRLVVSGTNGDTWYGNAGTVTISPSGGLTLGKYLYLFVILENYSYSRQGYLEGAGCIQPTVTITTATDIPNYTGGSSYDLSTATLTYGAYDLPTGAYTGLVEMTGPNITSVQVTSEFNYLGDETTPPVSTLSLRLLVVCGDVVPTCSAIPGFAVYDLTHNRQIFLDPSNLTTLDLNRINGALSRHGKVVGAVYRSLYTQPNRTLIFTLEFGHGPLADTCLVMEFIYFSVAGNAYVESGDNAILTSLPYRHYARLEGSLVPFAHVLSTGVLNVSWPAGISSGTGAMRSYNLKVSGGSVDWIEAMPFSERHGRKLKLAGTFTELMGVACDGLAILEYRESPGQDEQRFTVTLPFPFPLVFDTRANLRFHVQDGNLFVFGDFTSINGISVEHAAIVSLPSELKDKWNSAVTVSSPTDLDWSLIITPLDMDLPAFPQLYYLSCGALGYADTTKSNTGELTPSGVYSIPHATVTGTIYGYCPE